MMSFLPALFGNPEVQAVMLFGIGWLAKKIMGRRADTKAGRATAAIAVAVSQMAQHAITEAGKTPADMIRAFKAIVAIQFAKVGFTENDRAPYQPLIDVAIARAVREWVERHPSPTALTMPVTTTLAA